MTAPAPTATPLTAATTGRGTVQIVWMSRPVMRVNSTRPAMSRENSSAMMSCWSPPEQKPGPRPVRSTARASRTSPSASKVSASSR